MPLETSGGQSISGQVYDLTQETSSTPSHTTRQQSLQRVIIRQDRKEGSLEHKFSFSIREEAGALLKIVNVEMGEGVGEDRFSSWLRTEMGTIKSHGVISGTRTRLQNTHMQFFRSSNCPCRMYRLKDI